MPIISTALKRINMWYQRDSLQNAQCQQMPYKHMSACLVGKETMLGSYALTLAQKGGVYAEHHTFLKLAGSGGRHCELMHHLLLPERGTVAGV